MSAPAATSPRPFRLSKRSFGDRLGDVSLFGLTGAAAWGIVGLVALIVYELFKQAWPAIEKFGLGFITTQAWDPVKSDFGALDFIWGTLYTSALAVLLAAPLSIGIALFLSELAPRGVRDVLGALIEMLAAIPSVVIGLWGVFVLCLLYTSDAADE